MAAYIAEGVVISDGMQNRLAKVVEDVTADYKKKKEAEQNTTTNVNVEAIRLAVEVVCLMRRSGYIVKDDIVLEVIELCEKVAK
jgi:hypothetical protein